MNLTIDFLSPRTIFRYLSVLSLVLIGGWIIKDIAAILIVLIILYYCINKKTYESLITWLIWFFTQGFYTGQGLVTNGLISKYISKPSFLLFIIFIVFLNRIPESIRTRFFFKTWVLFIFVSLMSSLYHGQLPFILISVSSFFILYMLLNANGISKEQYRNILNLFIAVALLQTLVSVLQILHIIPAATVTMSDGFGGEVVWEAKLDDAASGTFGPDASHLVSWYVSMIALLSLLVWAATKKPKYLLIAFLSILQFATVDSKTVMGVMIAMMVYFFLYLNKERFRFRLNLRKIVSVIFLVGVFGTFLFIAWNSYYKYSSDKYGSGDRSDLNALYKGEVTEATNAISSHWTEWGKIQGFRYVLEDFIVNPVEVVFGYGFLGYDYNGKMQYIESKDTPVMQLDSSTQSKSGMISTFAKAGLIGFIFFLISIIGWYRFILKIQNPTSVKVINIGMLKIFSTFSLLVSFLYSFELTSVPIIAFAGLIAVLQKYSEDQPTAIISS